MKLLLLAPQPFFEDRGTPIAVKLLLEGLSRKGDIKTEVITYPDGENISLPRVTINRIPGHKVLKDVRPGASLKKLVLDVIFFFYTFHFIKKHGPFDLIHAVEESVFMAWIFKAIYKVPYLYDMDSSLASQLIEKWSLMKPLGFLFEWLEKRAIRNAKTVVAVCDSLEQAAINYGAKQTHLLRDISLLDEANLKADDLRVTLSIPKDASIIMYVGNLESYQGIDLLIDSFKLLSEKNKDSFLIIIGGKNSHINKYRAKAEALGLSKRILFAGPRPSNSLASLLSQATVLVSPRVSGNNTPMKIYSFLHSGKPVVATKLLTHTQVLTDEIAILADPSPQNYSEALNKIISSPEKQKEIGEKARLCAERNFTRSSFYQTLDTIYTEITR